MERPKTVRYLSAPSDLRRLRSEKDGHFILTCDLDLGGQLWNPIGSEKAPFTGVLDGRGFCISNFVLAYPSSDGNLGFFGGSSGTVRGVRFTDVTLAPKQAARRVGVIAGTSSGAIEGCLVRGTLDFAPDAAGVICGALAGVSRGLLTGCTSELTMTVRASHAALGGLCGEVTGTLTGCRAAGALRFDGPANAAGLFAGRAADAVITACRFSAEENTRNGALLTALAGSSERAQISDCRVRDNRGGERLLTEDQRALRQACVRHMARMGSVPWTPDVTLHYLNPAKNPVSDQVFPAGVQRFGMPYTQNHSPLERFEASFDENGRLRDFVKEKTDDYDGFDRWLGNDCSGAVYWAWSRVGCSFDFSVTGEMLPWCAEHGILPVGEYDFDRETLTEPIVKRNGEQRMAESWAQLQPGDAVVNKYPDWGHVRLCETAAVVMRRQDGTVDLDESYVFTHEQGGALGVRNLPGWNNSWLLHHRYTFRDLWDAFYVPVTIRELHDGVRPEQALAADVQGLNRGTVRSNWRIISTTARVLDAAGQAVWEDRRFTAMERFDDHASYAPLRHTVRAVDLSVHEPAWDESALTSGGAYAYVVDVLLGNGAVLETEPVAISL